MPGLEQAQAELRILGDATTRPSRRLGERRFRISAMVPCWMIAFFSSLVFMPR